jgi:hypothetical protein
MVDRRYTHDMPIAMHTPDSRARVPLSRCRPLVLLMMLACAFGMTGCRAAETPGAFAHARRSAVPGVGRHLAAAGFTVRPTMPVEIRDERGITELVASVNADIPPGSGLVLEAAVEQPGGGVSPWLRLARWGAVPGNWPNDVRAPSARVAVDELVIDPPAPRAWVRGVSFETGQPVVVRRVDVVATRPDPARLLHPAVGERIEWPVPFIPNAAADPALRSRLCSPTSVNMLINHRWPGVDHAAVVHACYSPDFDLYGVWPNAIQAAWACGVPGALVRFADWHEVRHHLETVGPLAISITAREGEVRNMPYESDNGHLIVLAGLTEAGDGIVIDPALRDEDEARRIYHAEDLSTVWLKRKRGTAYALFEPGQGIPG